MTATWGEMLRFAAHIGIPPSAFWTLSLREWRMLTTAAGAMAPMGRAAFQRLTEAWPDD